MCLTNPPTFQSNNAFGNNLHIFPHSHGTLSSHTVTHTEGGSWCPWYVVPDDVFIADIGGQALNIFPHSPESAQMMVIVKSYPFTHSHDKNNLTAKPQIPQTWCIQPVVLFLSCCFPIRGVYWVLCLHIYLQDVCTWYFTAYLW